jgi:hypothetical protein
MSLIRNWVKGRRSTYTITGIRRNGSHCRQPCRSERSHAFGLSIRRIRRRPRPRRHDRLQWTRHSRCFRCWRYQPRRSIWSNLVIVKFRNAATRPTVGRLQLRGVTAAVLRDAWDHSVSDITERRNGGDTGKFVINMSYGEIRSSQKLDSTINTDA